ncbi:MAG: rhodanese-like domain-containing protein [Myxococcales bacterium]|nr:rhodanese-like domain-containing protein [Myxococcales bacterium]
MSVKSVSPQETQTLLAEGAVYVDVRSEPEFDAGHPPGALNVPLLHAGPAGMLPNPEFLAVMQQCFGKHEKLVMGCRSGQRSMRAAEMLLGAGFTDVANLTTGWEGSRDAFGRASPGWRAQGLPVELGKPEGQRYDDAKQRKPPG